MTSPKIVRLGANPPAPETSRPANVLAGDPLTTLYNYRTDATGRFFCGVWESTPGKWSIDCREEELCVLMSGAARLSSADGDAQTFRAGDAFVIPLGFKGTWETLEPLRKIYAIYEP
jgi:uncharacterized cupin superfamily protein